MRCPPSTKEREPTMGVLARMNTAKHEQVVFVQDTDAGLRAIIAIHNTALGPAPGGTRM